MKSPIMDTTFEVNISSRSQGSIKPRFFPIYRLAKLIVSICAESVPAVVFKCEGVKQ